MNINQTFQWLKELEVSKESLLFEEKSNAVNEITVSKNDSGLQYLVEPRLLKILNDKSSKFKIQNNSVQINVKKFIVTPASWYNCKKCNIYIFESESFNLKKESFFKYFSKIDSVLFIHIFKELKDEYSISIGDYIFKISTFDILDNNYLVIKCVKKIEFKTFKHYINSIIVSLGFFSGKFYKKEELYFHSDHEEFLNDVQFFYRSAGKKSNFLQPLTSNPLLYSDQFEEGFEPSEKYLSKWSSSINEQTFSKLVNLLIEKPKFYFSIKMLFQFYELSFISRQATLFVILETITAEINNEFNSICIDKIIIKNTALSVLEKNLDKFFDTDYEILKSAINELDSKILANVINFEWAFGSMKIILSNVDKNLFKERNKIFHGNIIANSSTIYYEEDSYDIEDKFISNSFRLYVLISKLILKRIDFSGYILNHSKLSEPEIKESYFLKI